MPRHEDKFIGFDVPRHWEDRSIIAFAAPSDPKRDGSSNLVVTRETPPAGESFDDYVARQLAELSSSRDGFERKQKQRIELSGQAACMVAFSSHGTQGPLEQRVVFAPLTSGQIVCITMTTPRADAAQMTPLFDHIVRSITLEPKASEKS